MTNEQQPKIAWKSLLIVAIFVGMTMPASAHDAHDDPNWPYGGNTFGTANYFPWDASTPWSQRNPITGDLLAVRPGDGLRDLWDTDNDTIPDLQYAVTDMILATSSDASKYTKKGSLLRVPIDYESPGLIFWDREPDYNRRGAQEPWQTFMGGFNNGRNSAHWTSQGTHCTPGSSMYWDWMPPSQIQGNPTYFNDYCHGAFEETRFVPQYHFNLPDHDDEEFWDIDDSIPHPYRWWDDGEPAPWGAYTEDRQPRAPRQSLLTWQDFYMCYANGYAYQGWGYGGPGTPCPEGNPVWPVEDWTTADFYPGYVQWDPDTEPDPLPPTWNILPSQPCMAHPGTTNEDLDGSGNVGVGNQSINTNGTTTDIGLFGTDYVGVFDAVENLQTPIPTYLAGFSVDRFHMNNDTIYRNTGGLVGGSPVAGAATTAVQYNVEGAPDGQGISLGYDGFFFGRLASPIIDNAMGPGPDLRVHEMGWTEEVHGREFGYYCVFGAAEKEGPYYLIGTSYGRDSTGTDPGESYEDFDLSLYYNRSDAQESGGSLVEYVGIMPSMYNMHRLDADFYWEPWVTPNPLHRVQTDAANPRVVEPAKPDRDTVVQFHDNSSRHGHATWADEGGDCEDMYCPGGPCPGSPVYWACVNPNLEDPDPIKHYYWTFDDPNPEEKREEDYDGPPTPLAPGPRMYHNFSRQENPVHHFIEPGVYRVCLTVATAGQHKEYLQVEYWGTKNFTDTVCKQVPVYNSDPIASWRNAQVEGCTPHVWNFYGDVFDPEDDPIAYPPEPHPGLFPPPLNHTNHTGDADMGWQWDYGFEESPGVNKTGFGRITQVQFPEPGTYTVSLTVVDKYNGTDTYRYHVNTQLPHNDPPYLRKVEDTYVRVGETFQWHILGHDDPCQTLSYTWFQLPPGATLVREGPPTFEWTPTEVGVYDKFQFMVSDGEFDVFSKARFIVYDLDNEDLDNDGVPNIGDNCPGVPNHNQQDSDGDNIGDACDDLEVVLVTIDGEEVILGDDDRDQDGIADKSDNCPFTPNRDQKNLDNDAYGDVCDGDLDGDGVLQFSQTIGAELDNCPYVANADQADSDNNGIGDACDPVFQSEKARLQAAGCPGPFCTEPRDHVNSGVPEADEKWTGPLGMSASVLILGSVLLVSILASAWLMAEGIRNSRIKK